VDAVSECEDEARVPDADGVTVILTVLVEVPSVMLAADTRPRPVTAFVPCGWIMKLPATKANTKHDKNTASGVTTLSKLFNFLSLDLPAESPPPISATLPIRKNGCAKCPLIYP
jgi:hypothetical protein